MRFPRDCAPITRHTFAGRHRGPWATTWPTRTEPFLHLKWPDWIRFRLWSQIYKWLRQWLDNNSLQVRQRMPPVLHLYNWVALPVPFTVIKFYPIQNSTLKNAQRKTKISSLQENFLWPEMILFTNSLTSFVYLDAISTHKLSHVYVVIRETRTYFYFRAFICQIRTWLVESFIDLDPTTKCKQNRTRKRFPRLARSTLGHQIRGVSSYEHFRSCEKSSAFFFGQACV